MTQLALISTEVKKEDIVYTPDWVARDIVRFYNPVGKCLDPCLGEGAFFRYLPSGSDWCEIKKGKDFFKYTEPVDWIVGNPPYSIFKEWLLHSFKIAQNIVYLIPIVKPYQSFGLICEIYKYGGIVHNYILGNGRQLGFEFGFAVGAIHFQRGYRGGTVTTIALYK
jgi:hypothetical protein